MDLMTRKSQVEGDAIFARGLNQVNPANMWTKKINQFLKSKCEGGFTTHDFRKTAATNLYNRTKDIVKVQKLLGHHSIVTTRRYIDDN